MRPRALPACLLLAIGACGGVAGPGQTAPPLLEQLPRNLSASEAALISADNELGFDLFRDARRAEPADNIFLSPLSAAMALGMTLNGAAGATLDSMRAALHLGGAATSEISASYHSLIDLLGGLDHSSDFRIANSLWADQGRAFRSEFLDAARMGFDAEVQSLDLHAPAALQTINDWVKQKTAGRIPAMLDQVASDEVMFLLNAIYFKGSWREAFDPARTHAAPFHAADGQTQSVPTMFMDPVEHRVGGADGDRVIELLYGNGAFAMTIVLPGPGRSLDDLADGLDGSRFADWTAGLHDAEVGLTLPRFKLEFKRELKDDLSALGMGIAFDPDRADFSAMADPAQGNLFITRVTQKTFVEVNEEGTEAAAATSVGIGITAAPETIAVDRPFLFVIRERLSGTIFFIGQVARIPE